MCSINNWHLYALFLCFFISCLFAVPASPPRLLPLDVDHAGSPTPRMINPWLNFISKFPFTTQVSISLTRWTKKFISFLKRRNITEASSNELELRKWQAKIQLLIQSAHRGRSLLILYIWTIHEWDNESIPSAKVFLLEDLGSSKQD